MERDSHTDDQIRKLYLLKNIIVIGMSKNPEKAAHYVPKYLAEKGYNIIPVNPTTNEILGRKCYHVMSEVPYSIDIVDVFRPSEQVKPVVEEAIKMKPKVIWLQEGIHNPEAESLAQNAGIEVVFNRCMLAEHQRLFPEMSEKSFLEFYDSLVKLTKSFEQKNFSIRIRPNFDTNTIKICGETTNSVALAKSGLEEIAELAYATAEHHPYWNLLYSCSQILKTTLEKWNDSLTKEELEEILWYTDEMKNTIKKLVEKQ